ncbi:Methylenetetrahydrofolate reductase [Dufourea novaeangliae]|uniref:Methylenetetrahydrofolate reductase n=1 Tax=Dufourea novaeangliae TaxID=178035 RepID=A0A154PG15_DUFNO|nr:Methylenetetrahydrofolate reductase [Dufourea novaeangliae]
MAKICNFKVPENILNVLQSIQYDDDKIRNYGVELAISIIKDVISSGTTCGFHLFTLNSMRMRCRRMSDELTEELVELGARAPRGQLDSWFDGNKKEEGP